jgi:hypothetical protein
MPRRSNFILTEEQERELVTYAIQRVAQLKTDNAERIQADKRSWEAYENDVKWREGNPDAIFKLSNLHLPLTAMVVENFISAAEEAIVDEAPFFQFEPVGPSDVQRVRPYNEYYDWKLNTKAKTFTNLQDGVLPIHLQRAAIFKAVFEEDTKRWIDRDRDVLFDRITGQAIEIVNHGPIIKDEDQWEERPDLTAMPPPEATPDDVAAWQPPTRQHLVADPTFVLDETVHEWRKPPAGLERSEVLYRGPKSVQVDYDRFLAPNNAKSIEEAEIVAELYDKDVPWFGRMWQDERPWAKWPEAKAEFESGDATEKTPGESKDDTKEALGFDTKNPKRSVIEVWMRRDVLGWGTPQEFVLFIDDKSQKAIFYDFQAKVCPDFKRPFTAIAAGKTKDRWWGLSLPEKVQQYQLEADKQMNGELHRNKIRSNPFKGGDKTALKDPEQELIADPEAYIEVKQNRQLAEAVQTVTLPDNDTRTQFIVDYVIAQVQRWLGVSDISQGDYSKVPENATAYGIEKTVAQGTKIGRRWIRRIVRGFEEHVLKLVQIAMATLPKNATEVFQFTEGEEWKIGQLTATEIREIEINVKLRLKKVQDQQTIERANAALDVQQRWFATPPMLQQFAKPLFAEILQTLGFENVDELLPMIPPMMPMGAPGMPVAGQGGPPMGPEGGPPQ